MTYDVSLTARTINWMSKFCMTTSDISNYSNLSVAVARLDFDCNLNLCLCGGDWFGEVKTCGLKYMLSLLSSHVYRGKFSKHSGCLGGFGEWRSRILLRFIPKTLQECSEKFPRHKIINIVDNVRGRIWIMMPDIFLHFLHSFYSPGWQSLHQKPFGC